VLAAAHPQSTTADLVRRAACGVVTEPGRPEALAAAIRSMTLRGDLAGMGQRGRLYVAQYFDKDTILQRWEDLLANLVPVKTPA
jgi:glycosyltransferase involved in cell wall biosynthesis